jgi:serine/threonine kinase 38
VAEEVEGEGEASTPTMERVTAAKKFIENHYRSHMKNIQERKERYFSGILAARALAGVLM